jgi:hypothetical protein
MYSGNVINTSLPASSTTVGFSMIRARSRVRGGGYKGGDRHYLLRREESPSDIISADKVLKKKDDTINNTSKGGDGARSILAHQKKRGTRVRKVPKCVQSGARVGKTESVHNWFLGAIQV